MNNTYQNLPEKFLEKLPKLVPEEKLQEILQTFTTSRLSSFRVNTLKTTAQIVNKQLTDLGFQLQSINWYSDAFILLNKSLHELMETDVYKQGKIYIQNLSSMIPALVLDPKPNERVLDLCAAPGSKTTQLACLMHNQGELVANDISKDRIFRLKQNLRAQGVSSSQGDSLHVTSIPGEFLWKRYPEYFDKVLLDAPCSMEGLFHTNNPKTYTHWKQGKVKELAVKQQHLLRSAISAAIPGGTVVYSTCTLSPEENEGVIDWILKKEGDAIQLEKIVIPGLVTESGIIRYTKQYASDIVKTSRIWPNARMEGFFVAKITKLHSTISEDFKMI